MCRLLAFEAEFGRTRASLEESVASGTRNQLSGRGIPLQHGLAQVRNPLRRFHVVAPVVKNDSLD